MKVSSQHKRDGCHAKNNGWGRRCIAGLVAFCLVPLAKIQYILNLMEQKFEVIGFPPIRVPLASLVFHTSTVSLVFLVVSTLFLWDVGKAVTWQNQEVFQI